MSYRERRNRKDSRAKTAEQLHHNRCAICMMPITSRDQTKPAARGSGRAHVACPDWPPHTSAPGVPLTTPQPGADPNQHQEG